MAQTRKSPLPPFCKGGLDSRNRIGVNQHSIDIQPKAANGNEIQNYH